MVDINYKLSEHFTFGELTTTEHRTLIEANRLSAQEYIKPLTDLCTLVLEPVRALFSTPYQHVIHVTSGFRYLILNDAIGSLPTSQHPKGEACDFIIPGVKLNDAFNTIRFSNIKWGQFILELDSWLHISLGKPYFSNNKPTQQVLIFDGSHYRNA